MKNRVSALILTSAMVMGMFSGCGGGSDADKTSDTVTTASSREISDETTTSSVSADTSTASTTTTTENTTTTAQKTTEQTTRTEATTTTTATTTSVTTQTTTTTTKATTEATTENKLENKYDKLTKDNINDLDYFDHYAEELYKRYFPEGVFFSYTFVGEPYREVFDLKDEFKIYFVMMNYKCLNKETIKHAVKNLDDWNMNMCLCFSLSVFSVGSEHEILDYDTFCVDEEMKSILVNLTNRTKRVTKKTMEDYDEEVIAPFFDGTGIVNMNNTSPYVYCIYVAAKENACQISGEQYYPIEPLRSLYRYIIDNVTKDDIINGEEKWLDDFISE